MALDCTGRVLPFPGRRWTSRTVAAVGAFLLAVGLLPALVGSSPARRGLQGFHLNASDLRFILQQIKIASNLGRRHGRTRAGR